AVVEAGDGDDPPPQEFIKDNVGFKGPSRIGWSLVRTCGRNRVKPSLADEFSHRCRPQQVALVVVNTNVLQLTCTTCFPLTPTSISGRSQWVTPDSHTARPGPLSPSKRAHDGLGRCYSSREQQ